MPPKKGTLKKPVIGAAPARTEPSHREAPATEQRRGVWDPETSCAMNSEAADWADDDDGHEEPETKRPNLPRGRPGCANTEACIGHFGSALVRHVVQMRGSGSVGEIHPGDLYCVPCFTAVQETRPDVVGIATVEEDFDTTKLAERPRAAAASASAPWNKKRIRSEEVEVIGAAPAQTESNDEEAPATEQRRDRRAGPKPPAVAPPAKLQRRGGWFQKCQELSDAVLNGDHDRAMELAYCYRGKKHELEKLEKAQDQGYYSKK